MVTASVPISLTENFSNDPKKIPLLIDESFGDTGIYGLVEYSIPLVSNTDSMMISAKINAAIMRVIAHRFVPNHSATEIIKKKKISFIQLLTFCKFFNINLYYIHR